MNLFLVTGAIFIVASCVPSRKFQDLQDKYYELEGMRQAFETGQSQLKEDYEFCRQEYLSLLDGMARMKKDSVDLQQQILTEKEKLSKHEADYQAILENTEQLKNEVSQVGEQTASEITKRELEIERKQLELEKKEQELEAFKKELDALSGQNETLSGELKTRSEQIAELESALNAQKEKSELLKNNILSALTQFDNTELTVENRNGKIYVSLSEKLLFKSGSVTVDPVGVEALGKLAEVIKKNQNLIVTVEGHTDNVPMKGSGAIKDNWDLSLLRASSIVKILTQKYYVSPDRVLASGKGEFSPVASNDTSEGRARNRRTEIIITPKVDEILNILHSN